MTPGDGDRKIGKFRRRVEEGSLEDISRMQLDARNLSAKLGVPFRAIARLDLDLPSHDKDMLYELLEDEHRTRFYTEDRAGNVIMGALTVKEKDGVPYKAFYLWENPAAKREDLKEELEALGYSHFEIDPHKR